MAIDLRTGATQLVKWGSEPALATRVSIPNVNLLSTKGSILYGTGNYATGEASINGETYQYAEVKALNPTSVKSVLFNDGGGNLSWTNVVDNLTTNDGNKVLSAQVGYDIDSKIHISEAKATPGITMGARASTKYNSSIAIGSNAIEGNDTGFSTILGNSASIDGATDCIAIGNGARISQTGTRRYSSIQLGNGTNTTPYSFQVWNTPMLVDGKIPQTSIWPEINTSGTVNIGMNTNGSTDCVVIGNNTNGAKNSVTVGKYAVAKEYGTAIGSASAILVQNIAGKNSVAVGYGAQASGEYCVAIGSGAITGPKDNKSCIQIGNISIGMTMNVGKYQLMNNNGQIPNERLDTALSSIYQRLDDLGFKEGVATITQTNCTISGNTLQKTGKWCVFNLTIKKTQSANYSIAITIPEEFRPKETTRIVLIEPSSPYRCQYYRVLPNGKITNLTSDTEFKPGYADEYVFFNAWWELP